MRDKNENEKRIQRAEMKINCRSIFGWCCCCCCCCFHAFIPSTKSKCGKGCSEKDQKNLAYSKWVSQKDVWSSGGDAASPNDSSRRTIPRCHLSIAICTNRASIHQSNSCTSFLGIVFSGRDCGLRGMECVVGMAYAESTAFAARDANQIPFQIVCALALLQPPPRPERMSDLQIGRERENTQTDRQVRIHSTVTVNGRSQ